LIFLITPRIRLLCTLIFVIGVNVTPNERWTSWAIDGCFLGIAIALSRISPLILWRRLAVELGFIGVLLLGNLFSEGGDLIWYWGWLKITTQGLSILGSVSCKTLLSLVALNLLSLTTSISELLSALRQIGIPTILVGILGSMSRYLNTIIEEFNRMHRAASSRNLINNKRHIRVIAGNAIGSLFIRTYDRAERIHQAMLSRGYRGIYPERIPTPETYRDAIAIAFTLIIAIWM
jgi:cobalt/nickel transport system permease protein